MRQVILLRGVNLGPNNRVPMAELRAAFAQAGLTDAKTYVQSGNIVVSTGLAACELAGVVEKLLNDEFELSVPVVTLTASQLEAVVGANPFPDHADADPKRVQVTFLAGEPDGGAVKRIEGLAVGDEEFAATPGALYSWHPDGIARSKMAIALTDKRLGVPATTRNWATVTTLLRMATE